MFENLFYYNLTTNLIKKLPILNFMKHKEMSDEKFEKESFEDFINKNNFSDYELLDTISHLIHHRELLRDCEIEYKEVTEYINCLY